MAPRHVEALNSLANARRLLGRRSEARALLDTALALQPGHAGARRNLAQLLVDEGRSLEEAGRLEAAEASYREAVATDAAFVEARFRLAHLRTHRPTAADVAAMRELLPRIAEPLARARLLCALGFSLEALGEFDAAFDCMRGFHAELRPLQPFQLEAERQRFEYIRRVFPAGRIVQGAGVGSEDGRPVLVVGLPRSGTSLVEQILASHGDVHACGESTALAAAARTASARPGQPFPAGHEAGDAGRIARAATDYLAAISAQAGGAARITDTTPMNFMLLGLAARLLPRARFVVCRRDARDQCVSIYRQWFTGPHAYAHDLADLAGFFRLHLRLLEHWREVLPGRFHEVRYESLVTDPQTAIRGLLDFCGLPFEPRCLDFHATERSVRTPSASQVRRPLYTGSIGAWRRYERQLGPLLQALGPDADR